MQTKADLSTDVLRSMAVISATEDATAEDAAFVERAYDAKWAEWRRLGFVWWTNTDRDATEIPDECMSALVDLMENECQGSFGIGGTRSNAEKRAEERELLKALKRMNHKPPSGESTPFSSY
jgi:hypothetical protein